MDYVCKECGVIIREEDVEIEEEYMGEAWGRPQHQKWWLCPICGENVEEYYGDEEKDGLEYYEPMF